MALARRGLTLRHPAAETLLAALPAAMLVLDDRGHIVSVNTAAETLLNASSAQLRHKPLAIVLSLPQSCLTGLQGDGDFAAYGCHMKLPDGSDAVLDLHANIVPDHSGWRLILLTGQPTALIGGQRLESASRGRAAIGAAAMLAHEIKNPLAGIRGAAQLLEGGADDAARELTQLIRDEVDRVVALIDGMEAFSDNRPIELRSENIFSIIEHARKVALSGLSERVDIVDAYDPSLPPVLVNRDALIQVLLNLIRNAAEAVPAGKRGTVTLTTRYRHGVSVGAGEGRRALPIEVGVHDDGPGPPPDIVDQMFEPFVTSKASGRGLGLALVDKLVRDNGGIVQFGREAHRSSFRILLPRAP